MIFREIKHPHVSSLKATVHLDETSGWFHTTLNGARINGKSFDVVAAEIRTRWDAQVQITWRPVIQVHLGVEGHTAMGADPQVAAMEISLERFYIAELEKGQQYLKSAWDGDRTKGGHRKERLAGAERWYPSTWTGAPKDADGRLILPARVGVQSTKPYLADYTEALWVALRQVVEGLHAARRTVRDLVGSPEGIAQLSAAGVVQLASIPIAALNAGPPADAVAPAASRSVTKRRPPTS